MQDSDLVPVFVELKLPGRGGNPTSIARGTICIAPAVADPRVLEPAIINGGEAVMGSVIWDGMLWRRPSPGEHLGRALSQSAFGIPDVPVPRSTFVDYPLGEGHPLLPFRSWREELENLRQKLSGGLMCCEGRLYVRWLAPKIRVHWPRQTGSAPSMSLCAVGGDDGSEDTYFPLGGYAAAQRLIAAYRKSDLDRCNNLTFSPALAAMLAGDSDGTEDFAKGTARWVDAIFERDDIAYLCSHYGLLPSGMLADLEVVRRRLGGASDILDAVVRLHEEASEAAIDALQSDLTVTTGSEAAKGAAKLATMIARMTRLAANRRRIERPALAMGMVAEDDEALSSLTNW